jgi:hypothetical protein
LGNEVDVREERCVWTEGPYCVDEVTSVGIVDDSTSKGRREVEIVSVQLGGRGDKEN